MKKLLAAAGIIVLGIFLLFGCGQNETETIDTIVFELPG